MKKHALIVLAVLAGVAILFPAVVGATPTTVTAHLSGAGPENSGGYYIDPYTGTINNGAVQDYFCVDYNHESYIGETWTADVTPMTSSDFTNTYQYQYALAETLSPSAANSQAQKIYEEMVAVIENFPVSGTTADRDAATWVIWDISAAAQTNVDWAHSSYTDLGFTASEYQTYEDIALNYQNYNYSGWEILTDVNGSAQEFAVYVPEPNSLIFLGFSLLTVAGAVTLKVRKAHA
jgi:hypothetical protein